MTNTIQQLEDLKEWAQDSTRYERRLNFRGGQLVQPGPGRQGYGGKFTNRDIAQIKKGLPEGITVYQDTSGAWRYKVEIKTQGKGKETQYFTKTKTIQTGKENLDDLIEFREKTYKDLYPNRIDDETFTKLRFEGKNSKLSDKAFADLLHEKGYTGWRGESFSSTEGTGGRKTVMRIQDRLGWSDEVGPRNFRSLDEIKNIVRTASGGKKIIKKLEGESSAAWESRLRKRAHVIEIGEKSHKTKFGSSNEHKLWNNYLTASEGDRIVRGGTWNGKSLADKKNFPRDSSG